MQIKLIRGTNCTGKSSAAYYLVSSEGSRGKINIRLGQNSPEDDISANCLNPQPSKRVKKKKVALELQNQKGVKKSKKKKKIQ